MGCIAAGVAGVPVGKERPYSPDDSPVPCMASETCVATGDMHVKSLKFPKVRVVMIHDSMLLTTVGPLAHRYRD